MAMEVAPGRLDCRHHTAKPRSPERDGVGSACGERNRPTTPREMKHGNARTTLRHSRALFLCRGSVSWPPASRCGPRATATAFRAVVLISRCAIGALQSSAVHRRGAHFVVQQLQQGDLSSAERRRACGRSMLINSGRGEIYNPDR